LAKIFDSDFLTRESFELNFDLNFSQISLEFIT